jgi:hypothetical protein
VWVEDRAGWPGDPRNVWMQWGVETWPAHLSAFVHLRRNGETVAQADGAPTFWGSELPPRAASGAAYLNDWRQVTIPADAATDGDCGTLAVGLYDPQSGERVPLIERRRTGQSRWPRRARRRSADQACALIPATCGGKWAADVKVAHAKVFHCLWRPKGYGG